MSTRTGPRNATTNARTGQRVYQWRGQRFPSVTSIISAGCPKPALLPWGVKMVAEGAVDLIDTLPALVAKDKGAAIQMLKNLPWSRREKAADAGTDLHAAAEAYVLGQPWPEPTDPTVVALLEQFKHFCERYQPVYEATEATVYSRRWGYAGTLDAIATIGGRKLLLDTKTGSSADKGPFPEAAAQLSAYRYAEVIGLPDGSEAPVPEVDGCAVLHIVPDRYRLIEVRADEEVFKSFLYMKEVARFQQELSKTVIGGEIPAPVAA